MKKPLTILWIFIVIATVFIFKNFYGPQSIDETIIERISNENDPFSDLSELNTSNLPKNYTEYLSIGKSNFEKGQYQLAIEAFSSAAKLNPNSTAPHHQLAEAYLKNAENAEARRVFKKITDMNEKDLEAKIGIVRSYLNARDVENAKKELEKLNQEDPLTKYYKAVISILFKDFDGAKSKFEEILASEISRPSNEIIKKTESFLDTYDNFSYFKEGSPLFLQTLLAKTLSTNGHFEESIPLLYDVITQKNNYRDAWIVLGYAYLNTGKIPDAIDALNKARVFDEDKAETLFYLGLAYFANNEIDNAIFYLEEAKRKGFPHTDQIDNKLGDLYILKENYQKAAQYYEKVISKNTSNLDVFTRLVYLNIDKLNNSKKALEVAQIAYQNHPEEAVSYNLMGWALTANGNLQEAGQYLAKALELEPSFDAATLNLGWLYEKSGQKTLAKEYYKKAYLISQTKAITDLATLRYKKLSEEEKNTFQMVDISSPNSP